MLDTNEDVLTQSLLRVANITLVDFNESCLSDDEVELFLDAVMEHIEDELFEIRRNRRMGEES